MSKTKKPTNKPARDAYPKLPSAAAPAQPAASTSHAIRETVESIVIAFVLAFLFRTFEAEAFVIPTGSMAPTLMGRHKDVDCDKCGHRFQINSSEENDEEMLARLSTRNLGERQQAIAQATCLAGMCPMCRHVLPVRSDLPSFVPERLEEKDIVDQPSYNGDRILVNKYDYTVNDPQRWDVVVFKFPGNAQVNYIKRLVGLPNEKIRIFQGDLFTAPNGKSEGDFAIATKPADTVLAMRQLVHDTNYDPTELYQAGWPLRWSSEGGDTGWKAELNSDAANIGQRYTVDAGTDAAWLRYRHNIPSYDDWQSVEQGKTLDTANTSQLITDFNAYNTRVSDYSAMHRRSLQVDPMKLGLHWVGDLMVEADVEIESDKGQLLVDLVEAGEHFTATIDVATGRATLSCKGLSDFAPTAETPVKGPGKYRVAFANFDDQLFLWVDGKLVDFENDTHYDADALFGDRESIIPRTSADDPGDLAPVGIGAVDAKIAVDRLQVWRDIYYIADRWDRSRMPGAGVISDFADRYLGELPLLAREPGRWDLFRQRRAVDFPIGEDMYFVMGDNSPESSDARLWLGPGGTLGRPGGAYLERDLLIGKALCVYWPHSWNRVPGTPIPFPLFPNVEDMRLVR
jgi:signal peptidase I